MGIPTAYFLTWTCYGTWLHGDPRGSVDREHNQYQTPVIPPSAALETRRAMTLEHVPEWFCHEARLCVDRTIRAHAAHRNWNIHALNVRSNHVHLVVSAGVPPELVVHQMKSWSTRLLREGGWVAASTRVWTSHGSTRYLWDGDGLSQAIEYVLNGQ